MCVLLYIPPMIGVPDDDTLRECWEANPHGAGFAYTTKRAVAWQKGFETFEEFLYAFKAAKIPARSHVLIHFRIATHGGIVPHLTHPFPTAGDLFSLSGSAPSVVAHNGILSVPVASELHSDTSSFTCQAYRALMPFTGHDWARHAITSIVRGSRVMELTPFGPVFFGETWKERGGVYFSNLNHEHPAALPGANWSWIKGAQEDEWEDAQEDEGEDARGLECIGCGMYLLNEDIPESGRCPFCGCDLVPF